MDNKKTYKVFVHEHNGKKSASIGVSKKSDNGYDNIYYKAIFKDGAIPENGEYIEIKSMDLGINVYTTKDGTKVVQPLVYVNDWIVSNK